MRKIFFNVGNFTVAAFVAGHAYALLVPIPPVDIVASLAAVVLSSLLYFTVGSALTATVIALTTNDRFVRVWRENYSWMPVNYLATALSGAALALAYQSLGVAGALVFVLPLVAAWQSFQLFMLRAADVHGRIADLSAANELLRATNARLESTRLSAVASLVHGLTELPLPSVATIASTSPVVAVGRDLGMSEDELLALHVSYLLHDVGKVGLSEEILAKREPLTSDEWTQIRTHPTIGAQLLAPLPSMRAVHPIVLAHHEHFDGTGYPRGLKGTDIPLGARLIAVADAFEAMTSARPYRPAKSAEEAIREMRACAGTQLDPDIVERYAARIAPQLGRAAELGALRPAESGVAQAP